MAELSWWFSPHPDWEPTEDWPEEVPVVRYENDDEVALIDPFLPLDDSFDVRGKPVRVLLTQGAHYRGTADFVERYDASVWTPPRAVWRKIPNPATTDVLPRGIDAIELAGEPQQVVFFIREHATLVSGDVLSGTGGRLARLRRRGRSRAPAPVTRRARRPPDRARDHPARRPDPRERCRAHPSGSRRGSARLARATRRGKSRRVSEHLALPGRARQARGAGGRSGGSRLRAAVAQAAPC